MLKRRHEVMRQRRANIDLLPGHGVWEDEAGRV
jgi:hypothetical protein